eukprot:CAMPEP_0197716064 /NCGR_PEP_ID=MMETSP1434-20131217/1094_1 /TAXON_ID=265543 /ORGANISM="Minutocellus polymorphus, Strain CCMP3303" /LENGTH=33 /DNA_ID= /DNA_START= /DNA_END= /DNA_ORIENTATION=
MEQCGDMDGWMDEWMGMESVHMNVLGFSARGWN